jgi:hypothetical protein
VPSLQIAVAPAGWVTGTLGVGVGVCTTVGEIVGVGVDDGVSVGGSDSLGDAVGVGVEAQFDSTRAIASCSARVTHRPYFALTAT